jgi:two-component system response regulator EvgA
VRVLIVDDDRRVRRALHETLGREPDLDVVAATGDAAEARLLAAQTGPSVVLLDVLLPDAATGLQLVGELGRRAGCSVVAMSIRGDLRAAALDAGAVAFVDKGEGIDAILQAVRSAVAPVT